MDAGVFRNKTSLLPLKKKKHSLTKATGNHALYGSYRPSEAHASEFRRPREESPPLPPDIFKEI